MFLGKVTTNFIYFTRVGSVLLANIVQDCEILPGDKHSHAYSAQVLRRGQNIRNIDTDLTKADAIKLFMAVIKECV
jgi:hypothetical protein